MNQNKRVCAKKNSVFRTLQRVIGPGFITGASDDDPSGIATYSQTGAKFGYMQLWTAIFAFPFMVVIQEICGRIGLATGKGLAAVIREHYGRRILTFTVLLISIANTINIGADLGAMASSAQLIVHLPFAVLLFGLTLLTILLEVFASYKTYSKYLKYLTLTLICYIIAVFIVQQEWTKIAIATFMPQISFKKEYLINIVAILGTTISPYMFFGRQARRSKKKLSKES